MTFLSHLVKFIRILHRNNSDTFDPFYFRMSPKDWITGLPEVLSSLWDITK